MMIMMIMMIMINNNNNNNNNNNDNHNNHNNNHKHNIKIKKYCQIIKNTLKAGKKTWDNVQVVHFQKNLRKIKIYYSFD